MTASLLDTAVVAGVIFVDPVISHACDSTGGRVVSALTAAAAFGYHISDLIRQGCTGQTVEPGYSDRVIVRIASRARTREPIL